MKSITIKDKTYSLPIFIPDATRAVTKGIDSTDLANAGIKGVVVNTYHLRTSPGVKVLKSFGGVKSFMNFDGFVVSDSGGWQVFSLIHRNKNKGKITSEGVSFSIGGGDNRLFTPEKSIQVQFDIGSDVAICLDDFTPPDASESQAEETVKRTIKWAKKSKKEYEKQIKIRKLGKNARPLLFSVIQGNYSKELRKHCAEELISIGFDGYGYGGYAVDENGVLDLDLSEYIANLIPNDKYKFALGVGRPNDIVSLYKMGWDIFDCTLPTRDARHRRIYSFSKDPEKFNINKAKDFFEYVYIDKSRFEKDESALGKYCDCHVCKNYSKAYLRHLFKIRDTSSYRLATIHNLRFYSKLLELLSK